MKALWSSVCFNSEDLETGEGKRSARCSWLGVAEFQFGDVDGMGRKGSGSVPLKASGNSRDLLTFSVCE